MGIVVMDSRFDIYMPPHLLEEDIPVWIMDFWNTHLQY